MSTEDFASENETAYLLSSPRNAQRIQATYDRAQEGLTEFHELDREN